MKRVYFAIALCTLFASAWGQYRMDTIYYDQNWKGVPAAPFCSYYRIALYSSDSLYNNMCRDFYSTGELQGEAHFITIDKLDDSKSVWDGETKTYYKSGKIRSLNRWKNGIREGEQTEYFENGLIFRRYNMKCGKIDGVLTEFSENGETCYQKEYIDGESKFDFFLASAKDGYAAKFRDSDSSPIYESPSVKERKTEYIESQPWPYYIKNGLYVSSSLDEVHDYGKYYRVFIYIANHSLAPIDFNPKDIKATIKKKNDNLKDLFVYSADEYIRKVERKQNVALFFTALGEGLAAASAGYSTSTITSNTSYKGSSSTHATASAYGSGGYAYGSAAANSSYYGNKSTTTTIRTYDAAAAYQAQVLASQRIENFSKALYEEKMSRKDNYLRFTTINPGESISGFVNLTKESGYNLKVVIDIMGALYEFPWKVGEAPSSSKPSHINNLEDKLSAESSLRLAIDYRHAHFGNYKEAAMIEKYGSAWEKRFKNRMIASFEESFNNAIKGKCQTIVDPNNSKDRYALVINVFEVSYSGAIDANVYIVDTKLNGSDRIIFKEQFLSSGSGSNEYINVSDEGMKKLAKNIAKKLCKHLKPN